MSVLIEVCCTMGILDNFKKYEQLRPEYAMDKITEQIQLQDTGDFTKLCTHRGKCL